MATKAKNRNNKSKSGKSANLRFLWRGEEVAIDDFKPTMTILEFLREQRGATGTKEGCAEGDCGACTVVMGELSAGKLRYRAINACIQFLGTLHGKQLIAVDDLSNDGDNLHPVQEAMVKYHGSQCGFCTPGFVMSLFALGHRDNPEKLTRLEVTDAIAGNLCRCTGYKPIINAAHESCDRALNDQFAKNAGETIRNLKKLQGNDVDIFGNTDRFFAIPKNEDQLAELLTKYPDALISAGATDVGLWVTKQLREFEKVIWVGAVKDLNYCNSNSSGLEIGAACSYTDALEQLGRIDPDIGEVVRRIGSVQIRNAGTIGGNIANGSPIGDTPPVFIALGATLELRKGNKTRKLPIEKFFIEYGKQDLKKGEFVRAVHVPKPKKGEHFRCFKIAKRFDQDISAVMAAFNIGVANGKITTARIAYGGMAGTPMRGARAEKALKGVSLNDERGIAGAIDLVEQDFTPMSDMRASSTYRMQTAKALLRKALAEIEDPQSQTRLVAPRPEQVEAAHG